MALTFGTPKNTTAWSQGTKNTTTYSQPTKNTTTYTSTITGTPIGLLLTITHSIATQIDGYAYQTKNT